jgi:hypothetical protein
MIEPRRPVVREPGEPAEFVEPGEKPLRRVSVIVDVDFERLGLVEWMRKVDLQFSRSHLETGRLSTDRDGVDDEAG